MKTKLYMVPTPIGNLDDMTFRAVKILKSVDMIGCEDTRKTGKLLKHFNIDNKLFSFHKFNERQKEEYIINEIKLGKSIAIVSDAGTPGISDPAGKLLKSAIQKNIEIECLPGATAFIPALITSGLNSERFVFLGFLSKKKSVKKTLIDSAAKIPYTLVFYESPHRIKKTISYLMKNLGDRKAALIKEISKIYETKIRGSFSQILERIQSEKIKGEFVIVCEGFKPQKISDKEISKLLKKELADSNSKKNAVRKICDNYNLAKNRVYEISLKINNI